MDICVSYYSECGIRNKNEDSVSVLETPNGILSIVADGLGGHRNGEIASGKAVSVLNNYMLSDTIEADGLAEALYQANAEIYSIDTEMKTTVAALLLKDSEAVALHVGDSRIYQIRDGEIIFQSVDHSMAQLAVLVGEIPANELRTHPDQNKLVRALGGPKMPKIEISTLTVQPGDHFLLCSDGFWEPVTEDMMLHTLERANNVEDWLAVMKRTAQVYSRDNHTAVAIKID